MNELNPEMLQSSESLPKVLDLHNLAPKPMLAGGLSRVPSDSEDEDIDDILPDPVTPALFLENLKGWTNGMSECYYLISSFCAYLESLANEEVQERTVRFSKLNHGICSSYEFRKILNLSDFIIRNLDDAQYMITADKLRTLKEKHILELIRRFSKGIFTQAEQTYTSCKFFHQYLPPSFSNLDELNNMYNSIRSMAKNGAFYLSKMYKTPLSGSRRPRYRTSGPLQQTQHHHEQKSQQRRMKKQHIQSKRKANMERIANLQQNTYDLARMKVLLDVDEDEEFESEFTPQMNRAVEDILARPTEELEYEFKNAF
ncbi:hypothetical protein PCE1_004589 [Barthelona sp. PCE]